MMELLPSVGWAEVATKRDLDQQSERLELMVKAEISGVRAAVARTRADFEGSLRRMQTVLLSAIVSVAGVVIAMSINGPH